MSRFTIAQSPTRPSPRTEEARSRTLNFCQKQAVVQAEARTIWTTVHAPRFARRCTQHGPSVHPQNHTILQATYTSRMTRHVRRSAAPPHRTGWVSVWVAARKSRGARLPTRPLPLARRGTRTAAHVRSVVTMSIDSRTEVLSLGLPAVPLAPALGPWTFGTYHLAISRGVVCVSSTSVPLALRTLRSVSGARSSRDAP